LAAQRSLLAVGWYAARPAGDQHAQRSCRPVTTTSDAHGFTHLVRQRAGTQLDDWIAKATAGPIKEIRGFAGGLRKDYDAVKAGITLAWSSGAVEGTVNRIKMIKRQMFGRANFDLLRKRVLIHGHPPDSITR